ncbi:hypothetical protein [Caulobacter endophyticus]|uniref:hypothetical protein n=1 Tax=Caulobacter endophyticus TaxID=2172652 RepID=UPI0024104DDF|nr:hypothetical protein [Caulobacter endophyticus]MDG2531854.1 hypothetical protein [Caulobacter endophyticus]
MSEMHWRSLTTRDPVLLRPVGETAIGVFGGEPFEARVVAILGAADDAPFVVQLLSPAAANLDEDTGLHLAFAEADDWWRDSGQAEARLFRFPANSPARREGVVGEPVGSLLCERRAFSPADVFAESETGGGSRMLCAVELERLVDYARTRGDAVVWVETYELRGVFEHPRIDLGLYGLEGDDPALTSTQRIEMATRDIVEMLSLASAEGGRFGFRAWVG